MLLVTGLLTVYTASFAVGYLEFGTTSYFVTRQAIYALVGVAALVYFMRLDYRQLRHLAAPMMVVALLGLLAVLIPGIGVERNGARRWLELGPFTVQPSEFAKLAVIIYISAWLAGRRQDINRFTFGFVPFVLMVSVIGGLVIIEPDMGTTIIIVLTTGTLFFVAGAPLSHLALLMVSGGLVSYGMIILQDYRLRLDSLLSLEVSSQGTDRISGIIGGEVEVVGIAFIMALYFVLLYAGVRVAAAARDNTGMLLSLGVTCWIGYQTVLYSGGALRAVPLAGVPLPFISYGGSSLIALLAAVGVLWSISRYRPPHLPAHQASP